MLYLTYHMTTNWWRLLKLPDWTEVYSPWFSQIIKTTPTKK